MFLKFLCNSFTLTMTFTVTLALTTTVPISSFAVPFEGHQILISAPSPYAVEVGRKIHQLGGNVVDVAVAVGLTLSVTTPYYAALGGGGFAMVRMGAGEPEVLDFREVAPQATGKDFYTQDPKRSSQDGGTAVGVPGNPMGLYDLHKKFGKLKWETLFLIPLRLAEEGFQVSGEWVTKTSGEKERFSPGGLDSFFKDDQKNLVPGEILKQPKLAQALKLLRDRGPDGFYKGPVAMDIQNTVKKNGGVITMDDLAQYRTRWLKPLKTTFKGHDVYLMPPPSSGGVVIAQALSLIERFKLSEMPHLSLEELHFMGEIQSRSYRGRALLGDPDFNKNPLEKLLSEAEIKKLAKSISVKKATTLEALDETKYLEDKSADQKHAETTHFSVMDAQGNAVSLTTTLNGNYGSGVVSERYGIALNNEMDDFTTQPDKPNMFGLIQGKGNQVEPGKRPLSSMSPTLVVKDGKTVLNLGAPGGPRIISGVLQVLYRVIGKNMDVDKAVQAPRLHHQFAPNVLYVDRESLSPLVIEALQKKGHKVEEGWMAKVYAIVRTPDGLLKAAYDHRGEGAAGGF